ncbi:hypothetical protein ACJ73_01447 [Blastomyces percursus]|uniref:Uncharacterized protein n=1 Tax=Blastomyces percursus TaxID=1658174 RepID=A0A1J9QF77_9EURO|nr:hypothetical protein ACJ73_01447 [Blastomyces percursus]
MSANSMNNILVPRDGGRIWTLVPVDASHHKLMTKPVIPMIAIAAAWSWCLEFLAHCQFSPRSSDLCLHLQFKFCGRLHFPGFSSKTHISLTFGNLSKAENHPRAVAFGSTKFDLSTNNIASINHAATEIAKSIPETFTGEHSARMKALANGSLLDAKLEVFRLLSYQASNNLIEDIEDKDGMEEECRFSRIIDKFRNFNLPRRMWVKTFSVGQDHTSTAFAEALFEAAINTGSLDIVQVLLEARIDPNQPINGSMTSSVERQIQYDADSRVRSIKMATPLLKAGANVDGVTGEKQVPALHITAHLARSRWPSCSWVAEQMFVAGFVLSSLVISSPVSHPLTFAASRPKYVDRAFDNPVADSSDTEEGPETKESETSPSQDHEILQDALTVAAHHGKIGIDEFLLAAGGNIDGDNSLGSTALETAMLLGANPNHLKKLDPLHIAAAKCDARALYSSYKIDVDTSITLVPERDSPMLSPHFNNRRLANLEATITLLHTPLQFALHRVHNPIYKAAMILLQAGAKLMGGELVQAVDFDSIALVQALLDRGVDINEQSWDGRTALQVCLGAGHDSLPGFLLRNGSKLYGGELFSALKAGRQELVDLLLAHYATPHNTGPNGESILEGACLSQDLNQIFWAIRHGPRSYYSGALCAAVCSFKKGKDIAPIKSLLSERKFGKVDKLLEATAVGYAASLAIWPVLKCLLNLGDLALQAAVEHGHLGPIDMLLTAGADVNDQSSPDAGATALQLAAAKGYLGIAKQLLELGAVINASRADIKSRTTLEAAAEQGRLDMVQLFLEDGAETEGGGIWQ